MIDVTDPIALRAEADRRQQLRAQGASSFGDAQAAIEKSKLDEAAREKAVESEGDRIMLALGFDVVRFSHPGPTKQTPGIADRRYRRPPRVIRRGGALQHVPAFALWWEAKAEWGRQSPDQRLFQEAEEAAGQVYVLGTHHDLVAWLTAQGIIRVESDGSITSLHA